MGICWLVSGILPVPNHPRYHRLIGSPHEGLGGRAVDPARFPSHVAPLCPSLDFHQSHGQALVVGFVPTQVAIPCEQSLVDTRGEGDPKHLPGLRGYQPPLCDYILPHPRLYVNPFLKKFEKIFRSRAGPEMRKATVYAVAHGILRDVFFRSSFQRIPWCGLGYQIHPLNHWVALAHI